MGKTDAARRIMRRDRGGSGTGRDEILSNSVPIEVKPRLGRFRLNQLEFAIPSREIIDQVLVVDGFSPELPR